MWKPAVVRFARPILLTALLLAAAVAVARNPLARVEASVRPGPQRAQTIGQGQNRAGIVVRFDDGRVETRCVAFSENEIGGDELLTRSGINDVVLAPEGTVCRIDGLGCSSDECFCQCPFPQCLYWAYYRREGSNWLYSQQGAIYSIIRNGDVDGWSWGEGDFQSGVEPPDMNFEQICTADSPVVTATATTQGGGQAASPQVTFSASPAVLTSGQCSTLTWQASNATTVTLDGEAVDANGSKQVCPAASQTWTLLATNGAGQTTLQASVQVGGTGASATTQPGATSQPTTSAAGLSTPTRASLSTPALPPPPGQPSQGQPTVAPFLPPAAGATIVALAPTTAPAAPIAAPSPQATATRYLFSLPPTETPRPRRELGAGGGPTPTPLLVARVGSGSGQAPAGRTETGSAARPGSGRQLSESRAFSVALIPGYIAYLVSLLILLGMGWYVLRRRNGSPVVVQPVDEDGREAAASRKE